MGRKRSPIVRKALDLIAHSFSTRVAKARRPIARKLLLLKRTKRFNLLRHYNYAFVAEYEFSPSNSRASPAVVPRRSRGAAFCRCFAAAMARSRSMSSRCCRPAERFGTSFCTMTMESGENSLASSRNTVMKRTGPWIRERFIAKFYEEMRNQKRESDAAREHAV
ncbi:hypothetical protein MUK42_30140 [Musa troglodytarum]|uniref:Uncharacterized protein n=2 Tax=Musa troglodytarum TaxID=320322 RepID=A0A9E7HZ14_9LILI|nr:hypothetical protein MUK42_30140 [Musa troglodytarum]